MLEALRGLIPDVFIDSMGYGFTFHVVELLGRVPVGAYVHYPTISTDMLKRVRENKASHNNAGVISSSSFLTALKLV